MRSFTIKTKSVNSKNLLAEVTDFVEDIIVNFSISWNSGQQRDVILEVIDEHLQDLADELKLDQWNVICDSRNNKQRDLLQDITHLDIAYRQRNCFNITKVEYTIRDYDASTE